MSQEIKLVNSHIEEYLDYYCGLSAPRFAVMIKGQWGAGKTWFIEQYCEKLKKRQSYKYLYVSLFGMTKFSDIEYAFFQQLHPVLSSQGMEITGKIVKGLLKASIKFDLDHDRKDHISLDVKIPEIPNYLKNVDERILIFDDLERCKIELRDIFGYINQFVEHHNLKVIIIANESDLQSKYTDYKIMKEKLIGQTFDILIDFEGTFHRFLSETQNNQIEKILFQDIEHLKNIYAKLGYNNLRTLKKIILDFKRIFEELPNKAKNRIDILNDILTFLTVFSIEIKRGVIHSNDVIKLIREYRSHRARLSLKETLGKSIDSSKSDKIEAKLDNEELKNTIQKNYNLYNSFELDKVFPSESWWEKFFDQGSIDSDELNTSISSKYFPQDKDTPNWRRLYYFTRLSDIDFEDLLKKVELEYKEKKFLDIGEIKHVFGIFLTLSEKGLYCKNKSDILSDAKTYINHLNSCNKISALPYSIIDDRFADNYDNLLFYGFDFREFKELSSYTVH
ncbi:P-loop NTPase fold protein [Pseudanabaena sp. Chao 1811]|uniref:P-loop NTPase fold protein n=1 Tax=Pseudanabaena sp. Chao 1811 TaxID=2963092 RepID=UPI0022F39F95|nr:P-loop NTPase fold protein [Pseudanabaena sp. Chao 1811]